MRMRTPFLTVPHKAKNASKKTRILSLVMETFQKAADIAKEETRRCPRRRSLSEMSSCLLTKRE